jgi:hypothetical protein
VIRSSFSEGRKPEWHSGTFFLPCITNTTPLRLNFLPLFVFQIFFKRKTALHVANILVLWYYVTDLFFQSFHMLPEEICMMCSLSPGDDKLAFSVFWEITPEAEIVNHFFTRSVVKSCVQLVYEHAQVSLYW